MPLTETDAIRIRQFLQKMQSGLIEGMEVFATYHDSNLASTPSDPTGAGTTGGWHREPTEAANWMSTKTAFKDTSGTWGTPIRVFGLQGTETAGVGLSADIPKLEQITFIGDGSTKVGWTAGTVRYGGNSYAIVVKAVGDGSTNAYIYWDDADGQTSFKTTGVFATAIAAHHWLVCINDGGKAIPAQSARILHGGLIQADTITATQIAALTITAALIVAETITYEKLRQTAGSEAVNTDAMRDSATKILGISATSGEDNYIGMHTQPWQTVETISITSEGNAIFAQYMFEVSDMSDGVDVHNMRCRYDSTVLKTWSDIQIGEYSFSAHVTPGSGSRSFDIQVQPEGENANFWVKVKLRTVRAEEDKGK